MRDSARLRTTSRTRMSTNGANSGVSAEPGQGTILEAPAVLKRMAATIRQAIESGES